MIDQTPAPRTEAQDENQSNVIVYQFGGRRLQPDLDTCYQDAGQAHRVFDAYPIPCRHRMTPPQWLEELKESEWVKQLSQQPTVDEPGDS